MAALGVELHMAAGLLDEAVDHREAEASVPLPTSLVVKNGSSTRVSVSFDTP